jgi:uridine kinase
MTSFARPFVLGIAGGSGSGKTTLVGHLRAGPARDRIAVLPHDAYYLDGDAMPPSVRGTGNWDHPDALENALYVAHLDALVAGQAIDQPVYDFTRHARSERVVRVEPRPVLIVEGILLLAIPEVRRRIDLRVYVDTPAEERVMRRMLRDLSERGRTVESVAKQIRETVRPMHDQYVEPSRAFAHLVVPWDWDSDHRPAVEALVARIERAFGT